MIILTSIFCRKKKMEDGGASNHDAAARWKEVNPKSKHFTF